ncbi:MAG: hypothetical protein OEM51_01655 [Gammaproteobacteria bacterium]|nr:hypothetical protein [Gammaproteobacteria bacterium]
MDLNKRRITVLFLVCGLVIVVLGISLVVSIDSDGVREAGRVATSTTCRPVRRSGKGSITPAAIAAVGTTSYG